MRYHFVGESVHGEDVHVLREPRRDERVVHMSESGDLYHSPRQTVHGPDTQRENKAYIIPRDAHREILASDTDVPIVSVFVTESARIRAVPRYPRKVPTRADGRVERY